MSRPIRRDAAHPLLGNPRQHRLRFVGGNDFRLYDCGKRAFPDMLETIRSATRSICLETYTLRSDRIGRAVVGALEERAACGVHVRVLFDAIGSLGFDAAAFEPLVTAGGEVLAFDPPWRDVSAVRRLRKRNHRKLLIVDDETAFTGGLNIGDEYDGFALPEEGEPVWRDTHLRVRGPVLAEYRRAFEETWEDQRDRSTSFPSDRPGKAELAKAPDEAIGPPRDDMRIRMAVIADGRRRNRRRTARTIARAIDRSQASVRLASPYFAPGTRILRALRRAARRGVRVEILTTGHIDHRILQWAHHATAHSLMDAGVRFFEFSPAMMHAKCSVFDERLAIVGSTNLDRQSLIHAHELNTVIDDEDATRRIHDLVERDLDYSHELTPTLLAHRPWWVRLRDFVAARFVAAWL